MKLLDMAGRGASFASLRFNGPFLPTMTAWLVDRLSPSAARRFIYSLVAFNLHFAYYLVSKNTFPLPPSPIGSLPIPEP